MHRLNYLNATRNICNLINFRTCVPLSVGTIANLQHSRYKSQVSNKLDSGILGGLID